MNRNYSIKPEYRWIAVDLDETLAMPYDGEFDMTKIGKPISLMVDRIKMWLGDGERVKILTARLGPRTLEIYGVTKEEVTKAIQDWTEENIGERLEVTCEKDAGMIELWDDRAIQVEPNTGRRII
jgi:hypothetical protein